MASAASIGAARAKPAQLARDLGVTRQSVHELIKRGILERGADGLVDVEMAKLALQNRVRPSSKTAQALKGPPPAPGRTDVLADEGAPPAAGTDAVMNYHGHKAHREASEAGIAQIRLRRLRGEVAEVAAISSALQTCARMLRDTCMNIGKRIAADAVASGDPAQAERLITSEVRRAFDAFDASAADVIERERLREQASVQ